MDNSLRHLVIFSEIFGLRTFNIVKEGHQIRIKKRKIGVFNCVRIILCIAMVILATVYKQCIMNLKKSKSVIISAVRIAHLNYRIPLVVACYFFGNFYAETAADFLNSVARINPVIENLGAKINYKYAKYLSYVLISSNFFKLLLHIFPYLIKDTWNLVNYLDCIVFNIPNFVMHCVLMHWITFLYFLHLQFLALNEVLIKIKSIKFRSIKQNSRVTNRNILIDNRNINASNPSHVIQHIGQIFNILYNEANQINKTFLWQLLIMIPWLFIATINNSFMLCQMIKHGRKFNIRHVISEGLLVLSFLEIVLPCVKVRNEINKMMDMLHFININEEADSELSETTNAMLLQTHHQAIEFSVSGALIVDGNLIYSIFGALTTYLVILLQFDIKP